MRHLSRKDFHWEEMDLMFGKEVVTTLIPHKTIPNHYHLKFYWREEETPEFFNIVNARENARLYSSRRVQEWLEAASVEALND